jgi:hypothetical protein
MTQLSDAMLESRLRAGLAEAIAHRVLLQLAVNARRKE